METFDFSMISSTCHNYNSVSRRCRCPAQTQDVRNTVHRNLFHRRMSFWYPGEQPLKNRPDPTRHPLNQSGCTGHLHQPHPEGQNAQHCNTECHRLFGRIQRCLRHLRNRPMHSPVYNCHQHHPRPQIIHIKPPIKSVSISYGMAACSIPDSRSSPPTEPARDLPAGI